MRLILIAFCFINCNNTTSEFTNAASQNLVSKNVETALPTSTACNKLYLFKKNAKVTNVTYNAAGKEIDNSVSEIVEVTNTATGATSKIKIISSKAKTPVIEANYRCDGNQVYFDVKNMFASLNNKNAKVSDAEISFPLTYQIGQKLEDAGFTMTLNEKMQMQTKIINREVKALEKITTSAGSWNCYKVTADVEMKMKMLNGSEEMNKSMESVMASMPKTTYSFWVAPDFGIVQILMFSGGKMQIRTVVTKVE